MSDRGWNLVRAMGLVVVVITLSPVSPLLLILIPLALMVLSFQLRAPLLIAVAIMILLLAFRGGAEAGGTPWMVTRAWCLLLGGSFVAVSAQRAESGLLQRSLTAAALATGAVVLFGVVRPGTLPELDWWMGTQIRAAAELAYGVLNSVLGSQRGELGIRMNEAMARWVSFQESTYPAFLALASTAALSLAWFLVQRSSEAGSRLLPMKDFRFSDHLVWVLIGGLVLLVLPAGSQVHRLGENAALFMGALYLLRGLAILFWLGAATVSTVWGTVALSVLALLIYPLVGGTALVLGLSDTWLDLRRRFVASTADRSGE